MTHVEATESRPEVLTRYYWTYFHSTQRYSWRSAIDIVDMLLLLFCRNTVFHEKLLGGFSSDARARAWANYYRVQDELLSWLQVRLLSYRWIHAVSMEGCRSLRCRMRCPTASYPPRKLSAAQNSHCYCWNNSVWAKLFISLQNLWICKQVSAILAEILRAARAQSTAPETLSGQMN